MTLTYLGGYDATIFKQFEDLDNLATERANFGAERPKTQNHELRIASAANQRLTCRVGSSISGKPTHQRRVFVADPTGTRAGYVFRIRV